MSYELPIWAERVTPSLQVSDRQPGTTSYHKELRQISGDPENQDYVDWVNEYRVPVQELTNAVARGRLESRGVPVTKLAEAIAHMTETPEWPTNRLHLLGHVRISNEFKRAARNIEPAIGITRMDNVTVRYHALLGVASVNDTHTPNDYTRKTSYIVGESIAQAAIGNIINVLIERSDDMRRQQFWHGYQWWDKSERYGGAIHKAAIDKLAALACQACSISTRDTSVSHPMLKPYRQEDGYHVDSGFTVALDTIHQKLGYKPNEAGIYDPIWEFAKSGGDEGPREVLANMISHATNGQLCLEDLEAAQPAYMGMHLRLLQRVEEACGVDVSRRASQELLDIGMTETME